MEINEEFQSTHILNCDFKTWVRQKKFLTAVEKITVDE
jgi:hypothetical protein